MAAKSVPLDLPTFSTGASSKKAITSAKGAKAESESNATVASRASDQAALPYLPKSKRPSFSSHRNDANAALALDLLADVEGTIKAWHQTLRQTLLDIQALYMAGPIVEGWLEALPAGVSGQPTDTAKMLRHGDVEQLSAYVDQLSQSPEPTTAGGPTQYRLCSLDADGRMHCQPCPSEQLGVLSQAIARHQQLRQLLNQKKHLEARLKVAAEALQTTRQAIGISSPAAEGH